MAFDAKTNQMTPVAVTVKAKRREAGWNQNQDMSTLSPIEQAAIPMATTPNVAGPAKPASHTKLSKAQTRKETFIRSTDGPTRTAARMRPTIGMTAKQARRINATDGSTRRGPPTRPFRWLTRKEKSRSSISPRTGTESSGKCNQSREEMRVSLRKIMKKIQNLNQNKSNPLEFPFLSLQLESSFTVPTALPQSQD